MCVCVCVFAFWYVCMLVCMHLFVWYSVCMYACFRVFLFMSVCLYIHVLYVCLFARALSSGETYAKYTKLQMRRMWCIFRMCASYHNEVFPIRVLYIYKYIYIYIGRTVTVNSRGKKYIPVIMLIQHSSRI